MMNFSFGKREKLKSKKLIELLFQEGKQLKVFPLKLLYFKLNNEFDCKIQTAFSVPKRNFKRAVDRNHLKRLMRESYRLEKSELFQLVDTPYAFMIIFMGKDKASYHIIKIKMQQLLHKFKLELDHEKDTIE